MELFSGFLHVLGLPKSVGAIYGLLFASSEPLCFADIVARLDMSKGSVSQGLAFLRQSGAVKSVNGVPADGGRRTVKPVDGGRGTVGRASNPVRAACGERAESALRRDSALMSGREYFEPELGLRRLASGLLQEKIQPMSKESRASLTRLREQAADARGAQKEFQLERIRQLETWNRQLGRVLPIVKTLLVVNSR